MHRSDQPGRHDLDANGGVGHKAGSAGIDVVEVGVDQRGQAAVAAVQTAKDIAGGVASTSS